MSKLDQTLTFRHGATVSNRFVQPPMLTNSGKDGFATQDTINYYTAHSKSGGMIITEYMYVSENGGPALSWRKDREQLAVYDDKFVPQLKKVAAAIKSSGNKAIMQIAHTGREANGRIVLGKPVYAPSEIDYPFLPYKVHQLTDQQIEQIIADFGAAVKRAVDAGFDGVEIHGANHYLIQQFFSAYSNRRTDHWGGSLAKRMNFPLAVVQSVMDAVKKYAPKDFIVGYRISPEEIHGQNVGYTWHESTKLIDTITKKFDLDYIHLSMARFDSKPGDQMLGTVTQSENLDNGHHDSDQPLAELFKPVLNGAKEIIVGGIKNADQAKKAAALADLVAVGSATILDPLFADKVIHGNADQIVTTMTTAQAKNAHLTQGLIDNLSSKACPIDIKGKESLQPLHQGYGSWTEIKYPDSADLK